MNSRTEKFIFIRHLEDLNNLQKFMFDAPLKEGQKQFLTNNISNIKKNIEENKQDIFIIHSSQKRSVETARLLKEEFLNTNLIFKEDRDIDDFIQGKVILPENYIAGDKFQILQRAWIEFEREAFDNKNLEYRFGQDHPLSFEILGESAKNFLTRNYNFLNDLFSDKYKNKDTQIIICCHSTTILILLELFSVLSDEKSVNRISLDPRELSFISWEMYKNKIQRQFPSGIDFGAVFEFDITEEQKFKMCLALGKMLS